MFKERRQGRMHRSKDQGVCQSCGGKMVLRIRGRDRRVLCDGCQIPPESCKCSREKD